MKKITLIIFIYFVQFSNLSSNEPKLEEIIRISREIIKVNHKLIILKGRNAENEINKLKSYENFIYKTENSITDSDSKILVIEIKK